MDRKVGIGRIPFDIFSLSKKIGMGGGGIDLPLNPRVCAILTPVGWSGLHCCLSATRSHGFQILFNVPVTRQSRSGLITNSLVCRLFTTKDQSKTIWFLQKKTKLFFLESWDLFAHSMLHQIVSLCLRSSGTNACVEIKGPWRAPCQLWTFNGPRQKWGSCW